MASPGELVRCMSETLGVPQRTVHLYDRILAENGLRSKSGRGTSAARVTAVDAANLLIAVVASPLLAASVSEAAAVCKTYGDLNRRRTKSSTKVFARFGLTTFSGLPVGHNLRVAIAALIHGINCKEFFQAPLWDERIIKGKAAHSYFSIDFSLAPRPEVQIAAVGIVDEADPTDSSLHVVDYMPSESDKAMKKSCQEGDLKQRRSITFSTIYQLGSLLSVGATL